MGRRAYQDLLPGEDPPAWVFPAQSAGEAWYRADPGNVAIHPGDILAGYRVTRLLGRGGMGEVWSAQSEDRAREVAIKVLLAGAAGKPDLVRRFEREAKIASAIKSPYVCPLIE